MSSVTPPVIAFELGVGEFRIVTPEAVYQIKVCHDLVEAMASAAPAGPETVDASSPFFKEISEELFEQVGRLARQLSVSVKELPGQVPEASLDQTGEQLENAKGQLEEIVRITEKASMSIMDTADQIQADMDQLTEQLNILNSLDLINSEEGGEPEGEGVTPQVNICEHPPVSQEFLDKLAELKAFVAGLMPREAAGEAETVELEVEPEPQEAEAAAPPEPAAAPEALPATATVIRFDIDVVFQTLYELCTNEAVKDHIKQMREQKSVEFKEDLIAEKLSEMAPEVDEEDGFYNFPIIAILKNLYAATANESFRGTLKKMNQTAATIFLDSVLPIEGESVEVEVPAAVAAPEPAPVTPTGPEPEAEPEVVAVAPAVAAVAASDGGHCSAAEVLAIQTLIDEVEALSAAEAGQVVAAGDSTAYTSILTRDRDVLVKTVKMANELIRNTSGHLTRILESLSFQDLSGQRIMKVVGLINNIQKQLLAILVSVDTKIKVHQKSDEPENTEKARQMAQEEVDKALEKLSGPAAEEDSDLLGPGAEHRLDQSAVNDLLAQLGF